jgi:ElaB/YqjD/DUF883 family membrane-anchored ribosome-binding protein
MSQDGLKNIKRKLQELAVLIKEETTEEAQELKEGLKENVNEMKEILEGSFHEAGDIMTENVQGLIGELETKAAQVQNTLQEKLAQGIAQKDEVVVKAADSLIESINKMKHSLQSK